MVKKLLEFFTKKMQKTNQGEFRIEKITKRQNKSYMFNGKAMIFYLIVGLIKKDLI